MYENKIKDKIKEIEKYLNELDFIIPSSFEQYKINFEKRAACERYFEKITEAVIDLAYLIIKEEGFKMPEEDKETFDILAKEEKITKELAIRLKDAKGMRNIISHQYGQVDDEIVFDSITEELGSDVKEFINTVKRLTLAKK